MAKEKKTKKKVKNIVSVGRCYLNCSFNNTIVTFTDNSGNVLGWSSSGANNFRGAKKSTPFASQIVVESACNAVKDYGLKEVEVFVNGPGMGREAAIRALATNGLTVRAITDVTPIPHNGCRPRKKRRM